MFRFRSRATGDLIMLEPNGRQVLRLWGRLDEASQMKGVLLPEQMPAALAALEAAIEAESQQRAQSTAQALAEGRPPPRFEGVSLKQRVLPMIDMIRRCQKAQKEIVWGV